MQNVVCKITIFVANVPYFRVLVLVLKVKKGEEKRCKANKVVYVEKKSYFCSKLPLFARFKNGYSGRLPTKHAKNGARSEQEADLW